MFGNLLPNEKEIVKDLLEKDGKPIGYLSCVSFFNEAGFTTQVSNTFTIARNDIRPPLQRGFYRIKFFKQKNTITASNIPLLRLLDVMRFIKNIPDSSFKRSVIRLTSLIQELSNEDKKILIKLAFKYNPAVRALLGALLEEMNYENTDNELEKLKASLNPITKYKIGITTGILPTTNNWNIL